MRSSRVIMKCDICGSTNEHTKPEDDKYWVSFSIQGIIDRDFIDKDICPHCLKPIAYHIMKRHEANTLEKPGPAWKEDT